MPPTLEHVFTLRGMFQPEYILDIKTVKGGPQRMVVPINRGFVKGSGIEAEVIPASADWFLLDPALNTANLDVRLSARTPTGHGLYFHYNGIIQIDEKSKGPISGDPKAKSTEYGDHEWFATPIVETSDPELKWMEQSVFVGEGRWIVEDGTSGIEYEVYRVRPSGK